MTVGGYGSFFLRCLDALTFARFPHTRISHQRRLLFLVASKNNQPHSCPSHRFVRERSRSISSVSADRVMGPMIADTRSRPGSHDQMNAVSRPASVAEARHRA